MLDAKEWAVARREFRQAQRRALLGLYQDGAISEDVFEKLVGWKISFATDRMRNRLVLPMIQRPMLA